MSAWKEPRPSPVQAERAMPRTCCWAVASAAVACSSWAAAACGGGLLRGQGLPRLVELLGDHLELVAAGGDELGGLGRGGRRGLRGHGREQHAHDAGEGEDHPSGEGRTTGTTGAAEAGTRRVLPRGVAMTRRLRFSSMAAYRVS